MHTQTGWRAGSRWLLTCCGGCALVLGLAGRRLPGRESDPATVPPGQRFASAEAASAASGRVLYSKHCLACHGPSGRGDGTAGRDLDPAPTDLSQPDVIEKTDAQLFRQITRGRRPMPSFQKLSPEDRWQIVHYVRALAEGRRGGDGR